VVVFFLTCFKRSILQFKKHELSFGSNYSYIFWINNKCERRQAQKTCLRVSNFNSDMSLNRNLNLEKTTLNRQRSNMIVLETLDRTWEPFRPSKKSDTAENLILICLLWKDLLNFFQLIDYEVDNFDWMKQPKSNLLFSKQPLSNFNHVKLMFFYYWNSNLFTFYKNATHGNRCFKRPANLNNSSNKKSSHFNPI
jgi:hypothetical protein